jgi:hypothetical protein
MADDQYQNRTVEELRDELRSRSLHTSGNKDELISRLQQNDADTAPSEGQEAGRPTQAEIEQEAAGTPMGTQAQAEQEAAGTPQGTQARAEQEAVDRGEVEAGAVEVAVDPYKRVYSPDELPANTAAAQQFIERNPESVDLGLQLPPEQHAMAQANIADHVETMAASGVIVEDPRLEGYTPPVAEEEEVAEGEEREGRGPTEAGAAAEAEQQQREVAAESEPEPETEQDRQAGYGQQAEDVPAHTHSDPEAGQVTEENV